MFEDKILLITGGTGSFGNAAVQYFLSRNVKEIRIFSRDESKQDAMRRIYNNPKLKFYIGDVRDINSLREPMNGVSYVFHAAALKQVPSCEFFPLEAIKTNVLGTENVLTAAIDAHVSKVVCLSTDKAAYPVNAMGISKAMMEKVFIAKSRNSIFTVICGTRYGNVLASRGSVVPLFVDQIKQGELLSVTDPNMTRFIMSLEESIQLVVFAFANGNPGDLFVQKAPSCYIGDLAKALKELFNSPNGIRIMGDRPGEKKYETLLTKEEVSRAIDMGNFFRVPQDDGSLSYKKYLEEGSIKIGLAEEYTSNNTHILSVAEIKDKLLSLTYIKEELRGRLL